MRHKRSYAFVLATALLLVAANRPTVPPKPTGTQTKTDIYLPVRVLEQPEQLWRMFRHRQELELDLYLALLRESALKRSDSLQISLDQLSHEMNLSQRMNRSVYRSLLQNALDVLEKEYRQIQKESFGVRLVREKGEKEVVIPEEYWTFDWAGQMSFPAKWVFLVSLDLAKESPHPNGWMVDPEEVQKRFSLSLEIFEKGILELRRYHLIQVHYTVDPAQLSQLQQGWSLLPFYDRRRLEMSVRELGKEYGVEKLKLVRHYAPIIYAGYDPDQMGQMVLLYNRYGDYAFRKVMSTVAEESPNSPKRSLEYATALLQQELR